MFLLLTILFSFSVSASADLDQLASSKKWHRLLHYKPTVMGGYESQADGLEFFLHPKGKWEPKLELEKAIELFAQKERLQDGDAACKFPARVKWLNKELGNPWKIDFSGCQKYVSFFSKLAAKRASIVFSSYYLSNPNSAFGHTLLRLSRYDDKQETEMLDYGINYSAEARATNPFSYAIKGLFGGYKGKFAALPYYYKVREYSDFEFRDLWSYELKLTMPQVLEMVDHVWELGHTYYDYYYFLENCSYHLLSIIEVVMLEKELTSKYHVFAIPADTIRLLKEEGLIEEGKRRESTYSRLTRLSAGLTTDSLEKSKQIVKDPKSASESVKGMEAGKAAGILDVAMEGFDYYNFEKILLDDPKTMEAKSLILRERAINPVITGGDEVESLLYEDPAESHAPTRYTLAQGYVHGQGNETRFQWRAALHDLLDPPRGSLKEAQLEIGKVSLSYRERDYGNQKLVLQDLTVLALKNYPSQSFWASPFSWEIEVGARQLSPRICVDCPASVLSGSIGNSLQFFNERVLFSFLFNGEFNLQDHFEHGYRAALGPKLVSRIIFSEKWIMGLTGLYHLNTYRKDELLADQELTGLLELRHYLRPNFALMGQLQGTERDEEWERGALLGLQVFH